MLIAFPRSKNGTRITRLQPGLPVTMLPNEKGVVLARCLNEEVLLNIWTVFDGHLQLDLSAVLTPNMEQVTKCILNMFPQRIVLTGTHAAATVALKCEGLLGRVHWDGCSALPTGHNVTLLVP